MYSTYEILNADNYAALAISIVKQCSPETAWQLYNNGCIFNPRGKYGSGDRKAQDCIALQKEGFKLYEIAEYLGISSKAVGAIMSRYRKKLKMNGNNGTW